LIGTLGHVVESAPFSIFATQKNREDQFEDIASEIILCDGDTDTNASRAGNIMGAAIGLGSFSVKAIAAFKKTKECDYIIQVGNDLFKILKRS
jgi:ADP-ribosyl-[dinitrogen reductase] hydrolase